MIQFFGNFSSFLSSGAKLTRQRGRLIICCCIGWIDKYWVFVISTNITTNIEMAVLSKIYTVKSTILIFECFFVFFAWNYIVGHRYKCLEPFLSLWEHFCKIFSGTHHLTIFGAPKYAPKMHGWPYLAIFYLCISNVVIFFWCNKESYLAYSYSVWVLQSIQMQD